MRRCDDCTFCCTVMPVKELGKKANVRCSYLRSVLHADGGVGCSIYPTRPPGCRHFSCLWLRGAKTGPRPDKAHLVIDPAVDYVEYHDDETGKINKVIVIQVWIDPAYPLAHRDPAFREWLRSTNRPALVRYGSGRGIIVHYQHNHWIELESNLQVMTEHSPADVAAAARETTRMPSITINMDKKCAECGKPGAVENGLCLFCTTKALQGKVMRSSTGRLVQNRIQAMTKTAEK